MGNDLGTMTRELAEAREAIDRGVQELEAGNRRRAVEHLGRADTLVHGVKRAVKQLIARRSE